MSVPIWLQLLLGVFSLLSPQYIWIKTAIELAYELWKDIPFFHKTAAIRELRMATYKAKEYKRLNYVEDPTTPLLEWHAKWQPKAVKK